MGILKRLFSYAADCAEGKREGPIDLVWSRVSRRLPPGSGWVLLLAIPTLMLSVAVAFLSDLGAARWLALIPAVTATVLALGYICLYNAIHNRRR